MNKLQKILIIIPMLLMGGESEVQKKQRVIAETLIGDWGRIDGNDESIIFTENGTIVVYDNYGIDAKGIYDLLFKKSDSITTKLQSIVEFEDSAPPDTMITTLEILTKNKIMLYGTMYVRKDE